MKKVNSGNCQNHWFKFGRFSKYTHTFLQCSAVITWSIFSQIFTKDTPKVWGVFYGSRIWLISCLSSCNHLCNIFRKKLEGMEDIGRIILFSCDQAALRTLLSVCPSVTPFWQCACHRIILKFSGVKTIDRRDVHANGQGQRSKIKLAEVMTPFSRFRTVTPVWIHIWRWNDAQSLMMFRRGMLLFFKVICQISRSHG